jgi:hypothetical protein
MPPGGRMQNLRDEQAAARLPTLVALLCSLLLLVLARTALAKGATIAVVIEGPDAAAVRRHVLEIVPKTLDVIDDAAFSRELEGAGQSGPFGDGITVAKRREKMLKAIRAAAGSAHVDAVVVGRVRKGKSGEEVYLLYVVPTPGDLAVDQPVPLKSGEEASAIKNALGAPLNKLAPAPLDKLAPAPSGGAPKEAQPRATPAQQSVDAPAEGAAARMPHVVPVELFEVQAGFEFGGRSFDYSTPLPENGPLMRSYHVLGITALVVRAELYPLATTRLRVLKDLGFTGEFAHAFGLRSSLAGGAPIATPYDRFRVGLRGRIRFGDQEAPMLGLHGGYGQVNFSFNAPAGPLDHALPNVSYGALNFGVDGRIPLRRLALVAGFDYLLPLSTGDLYSRFKGSKVNGIEVRAGLSLAIAAGFEARLLADYQRYFSSFKPVPGDKYVAGGALDQLLGLSLAAAYVY